MAISVRFFSPYVAPFAQDNPVTLVRGMMASARKSLLICLGELDVEAIVAEAAEAKKRGVRIRWIVDAGAETEKLLTRHGFKKMTDWRVLKSGPEGVREKFLVVDGHRVLTGSAPFTAQGVYLQDGADVWVDSIEIGAAFEKAFECAWNETSNPTASRSTQSWPEFVDSVEGVTVGPDQQISVYFTPFDGRVTVEKLVGAIAAAESRIHFALPSLGDPEIRDALEERARAGVPVTGIIDARLSDAEHFKFAPTLRKLVLTGKIRPMQNFARTDRQFLDTMNAHLVCVDGQTSCVASGNFSEKHSPYFFENLVVIDSGPVSKQGEAYIDSLIELAKLGGHSQEDCETLPEFREASHGLKFHVLQERRPSLPAVRQVSKKHHQEPARSRPVAQKTTPKKTPKKTKTAATRKPAAKKSGTAKVTRLKKSPPRKPAKATKARGKKKAA